MRRPCPSSHPTNALTKLSWRAHCTANRASLLAGCTVSSPPVSDQLVNRCMLAPALRKGRGSPSTSSDEILPTRPEQRNCASRQHSSFSGPAIGSFLASTPNQQGCRTRTLSSRSLSSITVPSLSDYFPSRRPYSTTSQCILLQHLYTRTRAWSSQLQTSCSLSSSFGKTACSVRSRRRVENGPAAL